MSLDSSALISPATWPPASRAITWPVFEAMLACDPAQRAGRGSLVWRAAAERIMVLAWGRAVLMQYAHPLIAAAITDHSYAASAPTGSSGADSDPKRARFRRTLGLKMRMIFGTAREMWEAGQEIDQLHGAVHGLATDARGRTVRYSARDPELLAWVHTTLVDSTLAVFGQFVRPVGARERDEYLRHASINGPLLGVDRDRLPQSGQELESRMSAAMGPTGPLRVSDASRRLAADLLRGLYVPIVGPIANAIGRNLIIELLSPQVREMYGYPWQTAFRHALFVAATTCFRATRPLVSWGLTRWNRAATTK